jgi:signal transduction histidine kinase
LVDNALRYGDTKSQVIVELVGKRNSAGVIGLEISVSNKTGIASWPDQSKVFQKYYRSTGAQSISGTGLGLFLVASIAKLLGGNCIYSPDDFHVRFELWLPI